MKIRTGFVSNSSTSSFVIMLDEKSCYKALAQFCPTKQATINKIAENCKKQEFNDEKVLIIDGYSTEDSDRIGNYSMEEFVDNLNESSTIGELDHYEAYQNWNKNVVDVFQEFLGLIPDNKQIYHSEEM